MKKLYILLVVFSFLNVNQAISQTGLYKCNDYVFINENNPSFNESSKEEKILILDLESLSNNHVTIRLIESDSGETLFYRYNIKAKVDAKYLQNENVVQTIYSSTLEVLGYDTGTKYYVYVIDVIKDKSMNIIIFDSVKKTKTYFNNLKKF